MIEPNKEVLADESVPRVTLGGQQWPIPKLALAQNSRVFEPMMRRLPVLNQVIGGPRGELTPEIVLTRVLALSTESIEDFATVVYWGLTRAHKGLTRAEFDEMPIAVLELLPAAFVVAKQSNMFKSEPAKANGVSPPLEPTAASLPTG